MLRWSLVVVLVGICLACTGAGAPTTDAPTEPAPQASPAPAPERTKHKGRGRKAPTAGSSAVAPVASSTGTPGAGTLVDEIYALYASHDSDPPPFSDFGCFTKSLQALITAANLVPPNPQPVLNYDPVLDGDQDWEVTHLHLTTTGKGSSAVTVVATFDNFGKSKTVTWDVVDEGGSWRVDNVRSGDNDLRKTLARK